MSPKSKSGENENPPKMSSKKQQRQNTVEEDDEQEPTTPNVKTFFSYPSFPSSPSAGGPSGYFNATALPNNNNNNDGILEDALIIFGLVAVQLINSVYVVTLSPILSLGVNPLFLITFACTSTSIFVLPFAVAFESDKWPSRLSPTLIIQFFLIALTGVTTFQAFMLLGIQKTSPAIASAMPNLAPGIIFIIAVCLRFENVDLKCMYSRAKILGTVICLGGAIAMSVIQTPPNLPATQYQTTPILIENEPYTAKKEWMIGCFYLLAAVIVVSCSTVLQAVTMVNFPAPFSLCSITSLLGAIFTLFVQVATEGKVDPGTPDISIGIIIAIVLLGGIVIAMCVSFQTWAVRRKGPVLVSMFSPIQTVCSTVLSALFLGRVIKVWSLAGMFVMFVGLYMVLWAKKKEVLLPNDNGNNIDEYTIKSEDEDVERPLLS